MKDTLAKAQNNTSINDNHSMIVATNGGAKKPSCVCNIKG